MIVFGERGLEKQISSEPKAQLDMSALGHVQKKDIT
jgi:hypothetical protein